MHSTLASFNDDLLAIGGRDDSGNPISDIYIYDSHLNLWSIVSQMKNKRGFAVTLPEDHLMVVGQYFYKTNSVEISMAP